MKRKCAKDGCVRSVAKTYQKYCSKKCAPLAHMVDPIWPELKIYQKLEQMAQKKDIQEG